VGWGGCERNVGWCQSSACVGHPARKCKVKLAVRVFPHFVFLFVCLPVQVRRGERRGQDQCADAGGVSTVCLAAVRRCRSSVPRINCVYQACLVVTCVSWLFSTHPAPSPRIPHCLPGVHLPAAHQELHPVVGHLVHHPVRGPCVSRFV
jgi:hypothetical protein